MTPGWIRLFCAFCIASAGDRMTTVALFAVLYARGGAVEGLTLIALAQALPAVMLGTAGGRLAGRGGQRNLLAALDGVQAFVLLGMAAAGDVNLLCVLAAVHAGAKTLYRPVESVFEMQLIDAAKATRVNAWRVLARQIIAIGSPAVAALLLTVFNPVALLLIGAASCASSAALTLTIGVRGTPHVDEARKAAGGAGSSLRLVRSQNVVMMFTMIFLLNAVLGMQGPLFFAHLAAHFDDGARTFGLVMSAIAAGAVAASLAISRFPGFGSSRWRLLCAAFCVDGIALFLFTLSSSLGPILMLALLMGVISAVYTIAVRAALQTWPVAALRGRLLGLYETLGGAAEVLSLLFAAVAITWVGARGLLQGCAVAELAVAAIAWAMAQPQPVPE